MHNTSPNPNFLEAAERIAYQVVNESIWHNDCCTWLSYGINPVDSSSKSFVYGNIESNFYDGSCGIAYYLAWAYKFTNNILFKKHATGAINHALKLAALLPVDNGYESFYTGVGGVAKTAYDVGKLTDQPAIKEQSLGLIAKIKNAGLGNCGNDVINGPAGILPFLIQLDQTETVPGLKTFILSLGEKILNEGILNEKGLSWDTGMPKFQNLTGYAHGASGFIHALTELYHYSQDKHFANAALEGLRYERNCFMPDQQNWPDFRKDEPAPQTEIRCMNAWCHGAAGIGLSRIRVWEVLKDNVAKEETLIALKTVQRSLHEYYQQPSSFGLCHGAAGNADLLIEASKTLQNQQYLMEAAHAGDFGIRYYLKQHKPFITGLKDGLYSPGFMNGLAGIGYFYLRLASLGNVPSVLLQRGLLI
ncbi:MAG: hypothetical protein H7Y13_01145 [Sphingobacteriaceae bacterium]|nr:hypothetical protein [Sphingobacteriaceae bacterium]